MLPEHRLKFITAAAARHDAASRPLASIDPNRAALFAAGVAGPYFERLRRDAPVHFTADSADGPFWSITRHADIMAVEADHRRFSSEAALGGILIGGIAHPDALPMFIAMDPPRHELRRRTITPAFASAKLAAMAPDLRARTAAILGALPVGETIDWAATVAPDLAAMALATLFDFPQGERWRLSRWADVATAMPGGGVIDSAADWDTEMRACLATFDALWLERAAAAPGDDLIAMLAHGPATRDMPLIELLGNVILLIVGGHDTTRSTVAGSVLAVDETPGLHARLRADRSLLPAMIGEAIRWQTPLSHMRRTAVADVEMHGRRIARGDKVVMWYASGNRDETVFADPDAFDIDRSNGARHLAFGHGIHRCIGSRFAEMALRIIWEELLDRFARIEVIGTPVRLASTFNSGYARLPVRLHAAV